MVGGSNQKRYRGYRPPPLWWFKFKYGLLLAGFALLVIGITALAIYGILTGKIPVLFEKGDEIARWTDGRLRFAWHLFLWMVCDLVAFGGFCLMRAKLIELKGPSAETRL